jgi:hypothetical protein
MQQLILAYEFQYLWFRNAICNKTLITHGSSCRESNHILFLETPYPNYLLVMHTIWRLINYRVILIEDYDLILSTILIKVVDCYNLDIKVYKSKLFCSLASKNLIRFNDSHSFSQITIILGNNPLYPSLSRASWGYHNFKGAFTWNYTSSYGCLILWVAILLNFSTNSFREFKDIIQLNRLYWIHCRLQVKFPYLFFS